MMCLTLIILNHLRRVNSKVIYAEHPKVSKEIKPNEIPFEKSDS